MAAQESRRRSRWMMRVLEWDDARARYPNIWHEGMPRQILAYETVASRLRLGDLIAVYYPASQRHPERSERFLGISRVTGLRRADDPASAWLDVETAHRFATPLDAGEAPRRVFLCCDPGWSEGEVNLFRRIFDEAVAQGWKPAEAEREEAPARAAPRGKEPATAAVEPALAPEANGGGSEGDDDTAEADPEPAGPPAEAGGTAGTADPPPATSGRLFAGACYSGDMRDKRSSTWLAVLELAGGSLRVVRLDGMARSGFQAALRDPDTTLMQAEAIGLDFPFGLPVAFAESILGGAFPDEGWWALAKKLDHMSRPDYLVALQEFSAEHGEVKRVTDEAAGGFSPLHRSQPDRGPMAYHGIRMIAEERSRYAVRPFETAQGRLLLEVAPSRVLESLEPPSGRRGRPPLAALLDRIETADHLPVAIEGSLRRRATTRREALEAITAARSAAAAVLSGEADRAADELAPGAGDQVRREGWIYGLAPAG